MKIAVCMTGVLKNFIQFYENQKNMFFDENEVDLYIYTTDVIVNKVIHDDKSYSYDETEISGMGEEDFYDLYKELKNIHIDRGRVEFKSFLDGIGSRDMFIDACMNSNFMIMKCLEMVEASGVEYNVVMRMRLDSFFMEKKKVIEPESNTIYMNVSYYSKDRLEFDDNFVLFNSCDIDIYKNFLYYLHSNYQKIHAGCNVENLLVEFFHMNGYSIMGVKHYIFRVGCEIFLRYKCIPYFTKEDFDSLEIGNYTIFWDADERRCDI